MMIMIILKIIQISVSIKENFIKVKRFIRDLTDQVGNGMEEKRIKDII